MFFKKLLLFGLLASITPNLHAASTHEIRTIGLVSAGVLVTWGGVHLLCRNNQGFANKMLDIIAGLALIGAGVSGIVLSGQISKEIEHAFR